MEIDLGRCRSILGEGQRFALATVMTKDGSSPRGPGAKMSVDSQRRITGTVGGGLLEGLTIDSCLEVIATGVPAIREYNLNKEQYSGIDMTCGGAIKVLIEPVDPTPENREMFRLMGEHLSRDIPCILVTAVEQAPGSGDMAEAVPTVHRALYIDQIPAVGTLPEWAAAAFSKSGRTEAYALVPCGQGRDLITENVIPARCVCVLGGGHIGLKVEELARFAGFRTIVADDRPEFANAQRFPHARRVLDIEGYRNIFDKIPVDRDTAIVIVTRGHIFDREVLEQSIQTPARYVGMIGSRSKIAGVFESMSRNGISQSRLDQVHSPIGLPIFARTPAEIAVSIVAEIIQVFNQ
jgi:xanthine dehydrogenase accessory factor